MVGRRGHGRPKMTSRRKVVKQVKEIGLKKEDANHRSKWHNAVNKLSRNNVANLSTSVDKELTGFKTLNLFL